MNKYPKAKDIITNLELPYPNEIKLVEEFLDGRNDYPEEAKRLGKATIELGRLADFMVYFMKTRQMKTEIYFGEYAYGDAYLHEYNQIHIRTEDILVGLHEIGHAIYGQSELKACTFSTALIMKTKQFKDQIPIFVGHKLINQIV